MIPSIEGTTTRILFILSVKIGHGDSHAYKRFTDGLVKVFKDPRSCFQVLTGLFNIY